MPCAKKGASAETTDSSSSKRGPKAGGVAEIADDSPIILERGAPAMPRVRVEDEGFTQDTRDGLSPSDLAAC